MNASYRCSLCGTNWPRTFKFTKCLDCGDATTYSSEEPIDDEEAHRRLMHAEFDAYYAERERRRSLEFADDMTSRMSSIEEQ